MKSSRQRVKKSISYFIFNDEFIGSLLPRLNIQVLPEEWFRSKGIFKPEEKVTACTDGKTIWCCETFIDSLNDFEINGLMAHEVFHSLLLHMFRRFKRDPKKWNWACDFSLNPFVAEMRCCILPEGALLEDRFRGMTAERIYELLDEECDYGDGGFGMDILPAEGTPEAVAEELDWRGAVSVAATKAKKAGTLSAGLQQYLDVLLNPKLPWKNILYNFMVRPIASIASWNRMNRRYRHRGLKFPSRKQILTGDFVISFDVSGSMSMDAIEGSLAEIRYIVNIIKPRRVIIIEHDHVILHVSTYEDSESMPQKLELHGRGGTSFIPVFEYVDQLDEKPEALILFTDGYGPYPEMPPDYPVLWGLVETDKNMRMTYGEHLWLDL